MYVCIYVCMYGGHSVLHSNSKLHVIFSKMRTSTHTSSWILAARTLLNSRRNLLEEQETLYVLAKRCCSSTARSAEARISILCSLFQLRLNQAKRCCSVRWHKSPCTLALSFATRINRKVRFLFIKPGWDAAPQQQVAMQRLHNMYWVFARSGSPHNALHFN